MGEFTWITLSFIFFQLSAEVTGEHIFVGNGSDVTLPCTNVMNGQHECDATTWNFGVKKTTVELVGHGKIKPEHQSDRVNVTADCSLLIKNITKEDAGVYICQQFINNQKQGNDTYVYLSVFTLTEHQDTDKKVFSCSVWTYHTVKWQFAQKNEKKYEQECSRLRDICSATIKFPGIKPENSDSLTCEVTDENQNVYKFPLKFPGQKTGEENKMPVKTTKATSTTRTTKLTAVESSGGNKTTTASAHNFPLWAKVSIASGFAALVIFTVVLLIWKRNRGNKTQMGEGTVADPEDAIPYASIHFTKKARKVGAQSKNDDDDDDDAVTYSTVKASSSPAADSCDPSILYATVNKPK